MKNRFTQKAQNALNFALSSASDMGHTYIGSEHLLLGLCREESGVAAHYLQSREVDAEKVKNAIIRLAGAGVPCQVSATDMTPRTKIIIQESYAEAQKCGQELIGTEHLLFSILREEDSVAVHILEGLHTSVSDLSNDLAAYMGASPTLEGSSTPHEKRKERQKSNALGGIFLFGDVYMNY